MTRPATTRRPAATTRRPGRTRPATAAPAPVGPDVAAALARVRAAFGPVEVIAVRAHAPEPDPAPEAGPVQGRLLVQEAAG